MLGDRVITDENAARDCVEYILEHEYEDYVEWCADKGKDPRCVDDNKGHVYARALLATGERFEDCEENYLNKEYQKPKVIDKEEELAEMLEDSKW